MEELLFIFGNLTNNLKMRRHFFVLLLPFILLQATFTFAQDTSKIASQIKELYGVKSIVPVKSEKYAQKYEVFIEQPLSYSDTSLGKFSQRFFVSHVGYDRPTVIVTEGYSADYALNPKYQEELSTFLNANLIFVEHRYFSKSTPSNAGWQYLTAEASANDLHRICKALKSIYKGKWISTGISKGGQTTLIYRTFFPNDVDISVPYVAPLNFGEEDGRHEPFIASKVGTAEERELVKSFQTEVLKRRKALMPLFQKYCQEKKLEFNAPLNEIYDYSVLEYSFSFWQWGTPAKNIPSLTASDSTIFAHFMKISGPDYFVKSSPTTSFFVQAAKELGYYGYDTKPFKKLLTIKSAKGYMRKLVVPEGSAPAFSRALANKCQNYLDDNDPKMIFIYGEYDPWSAVAVSFKGKKENLCKYIQPKGSHRARISNMPEKEKNEIKAKLEKWLKE